MLNSKTAESALAAERERVERLREALATMRNYVRGKIDKYEPSNFSLRAVRHMVDDALAQEEAHERD